MPTNKIWTYCEDTNDWRYYTGKHTAVVWQSPDGWTVSIGIDKHEKLFKTKYKNPSKETAQVYAELFIKNLETQLE